MGYVSRCKPFNRALSVRKASPIRTTGTLRRRLGIQSCGRLMISQYFLGGILAARPHHAASRVACGSTQIQIADGSPVVSPAGDRPHHEQLVEVHRPLHDVAAGNAKLPFQIERT